jgi:hypothetical protein
VGRSLWREDKSVVYNYCWSSPAQLFSGASPVGLVTIFYYLRFETSLFVASYDSQGYGGGIRPRLHTRYSLIVRILEESAHGSLYRLARIHGIVSVACPWILFVVKEPFSLTLATKQPRFYCCLRYHGNVLGEALLSKWSYSSQYFNELTFNLQPSLMLPPLQREIPQNDYVVKKYVMWVTKQANEIWRWGSNDATIETYTETRINKTEIMSSNE